MKNAFVTGADRGLGFSICEGLLRRGWKVYAGQFIPDIKDLPKLRDNFPESLHIVPLDVANCCSVKNAAAEVGALAGCIDLLVNNAGINSKGYRQNIRDAQDYNDMHLVYDINALGPLRVVEAFLPLTDKGSMKRLCFVSSEAGSLGRSFRKTGYAYCMSKAALNMSCTMLFNHLRPEGYTFRIYHPGWIKSYMGGSDAQLEPADAARHALEYFLDKEIDEDRLVMRDYLGREWPW